jgi:RNA polymerase sigma-70 factor (ECF subfamily)
MPDAESFVDFIRRIRDGDEQAAAELVRSYERAIRVEVRARLTDPNLRRYFDSMDVCQSVLASFFVRAATGEYDLEHPQQLLKLLVAMARNKVAFQARKQKQQRRDYRRVMGAEVDELDALENGPGPSQLAASRDLLRAVRDRLTEDERQVADRRAERRTWAEIAAELGGTPEARRKQLGRALDRVSRDLGLGEDA